MELAVSQSHVPPVGEAWLAATDRPLDAGGPTALPFVRRDEDFVERPIFDHFRDIAERRPEALAVSDGHRRLTYGEMLAAIVRLAALIDATAPPGRAVGVLLSSSAIFPVATLACLAAGRPYVALDRHYPAERNNDVIADAGLGALILERAHGGGPVAFPPAQCIDIADAFDGLAAAMPAPSALAVDEPAVILLTSGSTGRPKGIVNSQRAVLQRVLQHINSCHAGEHDVVGLVSSFCTIAGTREHLTALLTGAALQVMDPETLGLRGIRRAIREAGVTMLYAVPALLNSVIGAGEDHDDLASVRVVRLGGDRIRWEDAGAVRRAMPDCLLQIGYSSTETTGTQWFVPRALAADGLTVPVGYALPGIAIALLDDAGAPVPAGEVGELFIRSPYVALGQWREGRCVPGAMSADPTDPALRIMPTGDLARMQADGRLEVIGRKDRQIKINGNRVEPAELEAALRRSPRVADAAVIGRTIDGETALVAFVAAPPQAAAGLAEELRAATRTALPPALQPKRLHVLAALPRLPSAKIDAIALQRLDDAALEGAPAEPDTAVAEAEAELLPIIDKVWRKVLKLRGPVEDQSWDTLGGDSLRLLRAVLELERALGRDLPLENFRVDMRPADFVKAIERAERPPGADAAAAERPTIFLMPGLTGDSPGLASFRADLDRDIRFVAIEYPDWRGMAKGCRSIEDFTDLAVRHISRAAPTGNLMLAGYSLGGAVAYATAARLIAAGRTVEFIGILDTNISPASDDWAQSTGRTIGRIGRTLGRLLRSADSVQQRLCQLAAIPLSQPRVLPVLRIAAHIDFAAVPSGLRFTLAKEVCEAMQRRALTRWVRAAAKPTIPVNGILLRSEQRRPGAPPDLGWGRLFESLAMAPVTGNHVEMLREPHRATACARFREVVERHLARRTVPTHATS